MSQFGAEMSPNASPVSPYSLGLQSGTPSNNSRVLVLSDQEQAALSKMDGIITQLSATRYLLRHRCKYMHLGTQTCETAIHTVFSHLKNVLNEREKELIDQTKTKVRDRIKQLKFLDEDIANVLKLCLQSKQQVFFFYVFLHTVFLRYTWLCERAPFF